MLTVLDLSDNRISDADATSITNRATRLERSPHLSCKHDQNKIRADMDRRVTEVG